MLETPIYKFNYPNSKDTFKLSYITLYSLIFKIDKIFGKKKDLIDLIEEHVSFIENINLESVDLFSKKPSVNVITNTRDFVYLKIDSPGLILTSHPDTLEYEWQLEFNSTSVSYDKIVKNNSEIKIHNNFDRCGILKVKTRLRDFGGLESWWSDEIQLPISKHNKTNLNRFYFNSEPKFGESCIINLEFSDDVSVQNVSSESDYITSVEKIDNLIWKLIPKTGVSANTNIPIKIEWIFRGCPGEFVFSQTFQKDITFSAEWMWTRNTNAKVNENYIYTVKGTQLVRMDYSTAIDERKEKFLKFDDAVLDFFIDSGKIYVAFDYYGAQLKIGVFDLDYNYITEYITPDYPGEYRTAFKKLNIFNDNIYIYVSVDDKTFLKVYNISQLTSFESYFKIINDPDSFSWFNFKYSPDTVFFKDDLLINKEIDFLGNTFISVYNNATDKLNEIYLEKVENVFVEKYNDTIIICSNEKNDNQPNSIVVGILDSDLYMQTEYSIGTGSYLKLYGIKVVGDILVLLIRDEDKLGFRVVEFSLVDQTQNSTIIDYNIDTQAVLEQLLPYDVFPRGVSYSNNYLLVESSIEKFFPRILFITLPNGCIRFLGDSSLLDSNGEYTGLGEDGNTYTAVDETRLRQIVAGASNDSNLNQYVTTLVTSMYSMFTSSQFNSDISQWDVSNVTDMSGMFYRSQFNQDISMWNVSNVTDMSEMFYYSQFNLDISMWNVSNVNTMEQMFESSPFNQDISQWDVSNVTNMFHLFTHSQFNSDISQWDVSNVTNMREMFWDSPFNQDISQWDVSNVTDMLAMFAETPFNSDISQWDVSNVTNMREMFWDSPFNQDISQWDVSNVTDMLAMFAYSQFNQDISGWDVSNVTQCYDFGTDSPICGTSKMPTFPSCTSGCEYSSYSSGR